MQPTWGRLAAGTGALFLVVLAFLAGRVRGGHDPALRDAQPPGATSPGGARPGGPGRAPRGGAVAAGPPPARPAGDPRLMIRVEQRFPSMGTEAHVRLESEAHSAAELERVLSGVRSLLADVEATLSGFRPDSELSVVNRDPRTVVELSPLMAE